MRDEGGSSKAGTLTVPSGWNFGLGGAMSVLLLIALFIASVFYIRMVLPKGADND